VIPSSGPRFFSAKLNNLKKDDNRTKFVIDEANMLIAARKYVLKQSNILETAYKNDPDNSEKQTAYENMQQKMHALENVTIAVMQRGYDGGGNKGGRRSKKRSIKRKRRRSSRKGRSSRRN
jgi:hypothetical protein